MNHSSLKQAYNILTKKDKYMHEFMERYIFEKINVPSSMIFKNIENFKKVIDFCLKTRTQPNNKSLINSKRYFTKKYHLIRKLIKENKINELKEIIYAAEGVGQKIGSFILEVFIHYGIKDKELSKQLFVPLDRHVIRVLRDVFDIHIKNSQLKLNNFKFLEIQDVFKRNATSGPAIIFDYLWFVGKIFHPELNNEATSYSRGYRLCSICWIRDVCNSPNKWN